MCHVCETIGNECNNCQLVLPPAQERRQIPDKLLILRCGNKRGTHLPWECELCEGDRKTNGEGRRRRAQNKRVVGRTLC